MEELLKGMIERENAMAAQCGDLRKDMEEFMKTVQSLCGEQASISKDSQLRRQS